MIYKTDYDSPIGKMILASDGQALIGLWLYNQKYFLGQLHEELVEKDDLNVFHLTKQWLDQYFNQQKPSITNLPLAPRGSKFQKDVWQILCEIPYGEVVTYGSIASQMAQKMKRETMSAQAVGGAVSHNPISIIIPCHRVVGSNGNLTGYAGGIDKKIKLLELEGLHIVHEKICKKGR
ncbi:methylated-DNA--[protein]-cysteine S-methyltransferase [Candidatus Stoquefichus sp. SB1]|uniref:methylated-DNA--[protein]-cysteine S-methyltransferase n=1 Tax=Candidatus Stoquefichus sp. SB1 TaxID=1658109 RepID=UPI00067F1182|nr:methylated-DNA--[protein]-cysteine S-methyltransferase [Candidatus Stoquefichus sp. SB1]